MKSLLVEDDPADARLIRELLKESPAVTIEVQQVDRLEVGLKRLRQETFDVVLLDLHLPDSQGKETLTRTQEVCGDLPIVVLTGVNDHTFAIEAVRAGAQDYLVKGHFDGELLVRTIRYAVERKGAEEQVRRLNAELEQRVVERTAQLERANAALEAEIGQRRQAEEALRVSEERYRIVADNTYAMEYWMGPDGLFVYVSPSCERITGYTAAEFTAEPDLLRRLVHEEDRALLVQHHQRAFVENGPPDQIEFRLRRRDGTEVWVAHNCQPLIGASGQPLGRRASLRDVTEHKRAEQAVLDRKRELRLVMDAGPTLIAYVDTGCRYQQVNRGYAEWYNLGAEAVRGRHVRDVLGEAAWRVIEPYVARALAGEVVGYDQELPLPSGARWVHATYTPDRDAAGVVRGFVVHALDIGERKRAEIALREQFKELTCLHGVAQIAPGPELSLDQILQRIVELLPPAYFYPEIAAARIRLDDRVYCSQGFREAPQRQTADLIVAGRKRGWLEVVYLAERPALDEGPFSKEESSLIKTVAREVAQIVERRRAEDALRRSESLLARAEQIANVGSWEWEIGSGMLSWSEQTYRIFGGEAGQLRPTYEAFLACVHPEDQTLVAQAIDDALSRTKPYDLQYRIVTSGSVTRWVHARGEVNFDSNGGPTRMTGSVLDITEDKRAEEQIRRSLAEKEILLKEVHHRVKNNMQVICSLLSLQSSSVQDERSRGLFENCRSRVKSMALVHERLCRAPDLATIDFGEHVGDLAKMLVGSYASPSSHIRLALDTESIVVDMDTAIPASLILNELVANAQEHAFANGRTGTLKVGLRSGDAGRVCLSVSDDGPGLPPHFDCEKSGSLGLKIVRSLTRQIHGEILFKQQAGTSVTILFPVRTQPQSVSEHGGQAASQSVGEASLPRHSNGKMPPEPIDKMSPPHAQTRSQSTL